MKNTQIHLYDAALKLKAIELAIKERNRASHWWIDGKTLTIVGRKMMKIVSKTFLCFILELDCWFSGSLKKSMSETRKALRETEPEILGSCAREAACELFDTEE